jgi:hypothetical protein
MGWTNSVANVIHESLQGNREVIDSMAPGSARVMESVLKLIDAYDLWGSVAIPKKHTQVSDKGGQMKQM